MWILSATAKVKIMVGNTADGGVSFIPFNPTKPTALIMENITTMSVAKVAKNQARKNPGARAYR